jgi:hypothetical protein
MKGQIVSPRTAHPIVQKYISIPLNVARLEPQEVGALFKNSQNPFSFFPTIGMFSVEFALGYCNNMHCKKSDSAVPARDVRSVDKK